MFEFLFRLGPGDWIYEQQRALAAFYLKNLPEAEAWSLLAIHSGEGDLAWSHAIYASALAQQGRLDEARFAVRRLLDNMPSFSISLWDSCGPARVTDGWDRFWGGLRLAGAPA